MARREGYDGDPSAALRLRLAEVGISLEEPRRPDAKQLASARAEPVRIDRGRIREILTERGAAAKDLRWLTISCPSEEAARAFKPIQNLADCQSYSVTGDGADHGNKA